jgi:hypothetical protein
MNNVVLQFFKPAQVYRSLANTSKFPWAGIVLITVLILLEKILQVPFNEKIAALQLEQMNVPEGAGVDILHNLRYLIAFFGVSADLIAICFVAFLLFLCLKLLKIAVKYKTAFVLYAYVFTIFTIGNILTQLIWYQRGFESITNIYETDLLGLNVFFTYDGLGKIWYSLLSLVNPFVALFILYLSIAVSSGLKAGWAKGLGVAIALCAIVKVVPVLLAVLLVKS